MYSYNSLSKVVGSNENTISTFIKILENAYFLKELNQFSYSLKTQNKARKKIYCIDNGFLTTVSFRFFDKKGALFENLVFSELYKYYPEEIYYYNDTHECDFIIHNEKTQCAIQVCYEINNGCRDRELKGLKAAMKTFNLPKGLIITYDQEEMITDNIQIIPFWKIFSEMPLF